MSNRRLSNVVLLLSTAITTAGCERSPRPQTAETPTSSPPSSTSPADFVAHPTDLRTITVSGKPEIDDEGQVKLKPGDSLTLTVFAKRGGNPAPGRPVNIKFSRQAVNVAPATGTADESGFFTTRVSVSKEAPKGEWFVIVECDRKERSVTITVE